MSEFKLGDVVCIDDLGINGTVTQARNYKGIPDSDGHYHVEYVETDGSNDYGFFGPHQLSMVTPFGTAGPTLVEPTPIATGDCPSDTKELIKRLRLVDVVDAAADLAHDQYVEKGIRDDEWEHDEWVELRTKYLFQALRSFANS